MNLPNKKAEAVNKRFQEKNNTLKRVVRDDANDQKKGDILEVELGDAKQPDFKPQAKIKRWKNEVNFSLRRNKKWNNPKIRTESIETGAKIKVQDEDEELHMYELDGFEDGGLEVEAVLKKKPKGKNANQIEFTLETKGLDFFYQPELTKKEKENGASRPENVVGSYAAYHKNKKNNQYKTGKAFHIYRPKIIDDNGNQVWGELNIDEKNNILTVTVPQDFLNQAVYPVRVDPTFGYTNAGGTSAPGDRIQGSVGILNESGIVNSISAYLLSGSSDNIESAIYDNSDGGLELTSEQITTDGTSGWKNMNVSPSVELSSATYFIVGWLDSYNQDMVYDSTGTDSGRFQDDTSLSYGNWPDPWSGNNSDLQRSIYATYTVPVSLADVTTSAVGQITNTSGDGNGEITDTGGADASERGFVYSTSSQSDPGNTSPASSAYSSVENETGTFSTGTFSLTISGLNENTTYYVRAYAENSEGYSYGGEVSFTTISNARLTGAQTITGANTITH